MEEFEERKSPVVDVSGFIDSPLGVHNLQSAVPTITCQDECLMGIDEAGRGPVLGLLLSLYIKEYFYLHRPNGVWHKLLSSIKG